MDFEQVLTLLSAALDGDLTPEERVQLNEQLALSAEYRELAADFGLMSAALSREEPVPAGLTGRMERALDGVEQERRKVPFLRRYGSMAAMLALVVALGAVALSGGGFGAKDSALKAADNAVMDAAPAASAGLQMEMKAEADMDGAPESALADAADDMTGNAVPESPESTKAESAEPLQPPTTGGSGAVDAYGAPVAPDEVYAALRLVKAALDGEGSYPDAEERTVDGYPAWLLETGESDAQTSETWLRYTGLSENGRYLTFQLETRTTPKADGAAGWSALFNCFAVSREGDEVLRMYDEHRTAGHTGAYNTALSQ